MSDDPTLAAITRLGNTVARLEDSVIRLENTVSRIVDTLSGMTGGLARLETKTTGMDKTTSMEKTMIDIRDDIALNFRAVDAVKRAHDNTCEEMRLLGEQVNIMYRQIKRLGGRVDSLDRQQ